MLSTVHNRLVMSFTAPGSDDNTGLTAALNHAYTVSQTASHMFNCIVLPHHSLLILATINKQLPYCLPRRSGLV